MLHSPAWRSETKQHQRPQQREDEEETLTRAEQGDRDRKDREEHHDEERGEIEVAVEDLENMEDPDA